MHNQLPQRRMFQFSLPGMPDSKLIMPAFQVLTVLSQPDVQRLPLTPDSLLGLIIWQGELVPQVDMSYILTGQKQGALGRHPQTVVVQVPLAESIELIAWPIRADANTIELPAGIQPKPIQSDLPSELIRAAFRNGQVDVSFIDASGVFTYLQAKAATMPFARHAF